jgi:soluble lytic murein transglycosylase-like protein
LRSLPSHSRPFAKSHSHKHAHHAWAHHVRHHVAHARVRPGEPGMAQAFVRTDATDRPFFGDPSFPNRSWSQNQSANQNQFNQARAQPPQPSFGEGAPRARVARARNTGLDTMIARHAAANGLPIELVHRVVKRESGYNARASSRGNLGLMQIRYGTARGVGYSGSAAGLLDPETNLTYAVRYLAGAYRAAGGNAGRAVSLYASGYHGRRMM